jgi:hypothetical protein
MTSFFRSQLYRPILSGVGAFAVALVGLTTSAFAWQTPPTQQPPQTTTPAVPPPPTTQPTPAKPTDPTAAGDDKDRIFGVLPNYTSVSASDKFVPISGKESIKIAALDSVSDPMVYPLYGFVAGVAHARNDPPEWGGGITGYSKRYGAALTDNTICSMVGTGLLPALLKQDPRYYQGRAKGFFPRFGYAAKASVVTKSRITGKPQFNVSEVAGTFIVASAGNLYYPDSEHTVSDTLTRWGMQAFWDSVSNELKEFWPDIKGKLHGK